MNGATPIAERRPANQLLTEIEEEVVVEYILNPDSPGYLPLIGNVEEMVNYILASESNGLTASSNDEKSSRRFFHAPMTYKGPSVKTLT